MPHSTLDSTGHRARSTSRSARRSSDMRSSMDQFPDHIDSFIGQPDDHVPSPRPNGQYNVMQHDSLLPRTNASVKWASSNGKSKGHGRQKSLSDAINTIRGRRGSVSANAHEIADALKAPVSPKLIILCICWYMSSALTNTSSKSILNAFPKPATLTLIQFAFVAIYCLLFSWLATVFPALKTSVPALKHGIRYPTRDIIITTLPLAGFSIGGHLLSSTATSKIPVSLVHTIKGLSPLFTVFAYRVIFDIRYPIATYLSLIPLTLGVMLACSAEFRGNVFGILYAFLAAIIFVTQNIFSKRLFNEAAKAEADGQHMQSRRLDKLNLLCYCSGLAFAITFPIWFWSEGLSLIRDFFHHGTVPLSQKPEAFDHGRLALEFVFNGTFHFGQNIIAFVLLSMVSPVTYSVASLIKRVFVVVIAIIWFQNKTTPIQAVGIALTFFGLYLYDRSSQSNKADRKAKMMDLKASTLLPLSTSHGHNAPVFDSPMAMSASSGPYSSSSTTGPPSDDNEKSDNGGRVGHPTQWLPPGTRREDTWRQRDVISGKTAVS